MLAMKVFNHTAQPTLMNACTDKISSVRNLTKISTGAMII